MFGSLANRSVQGRCASHCNKYAALHAGPWWSRRPGTSSSTPQIRETQSTFALDRHRDSGQVERAILRLLVDGRFGGGLSATILLEALSGVDIEDMFEAVHRLKAQGVIESRDGRIELSSCARGIAELGLLAA